MDPFPTHHSYVCLQILSGVPQNSSSPRVVHLPAPQTQSTFSSPLGYMLIIFKKDSNPTEHLMLVIAYQPGQAVYRLFKGMHLISAREKSH